MFIVSKNYIIIAIVCYVCEPVPNSFECSAFAIASSSEFHTDPQQNTRRLNGIT